MGFRIFMHSLRLVFTQLGDALRVSGVLYLVVIAVSAFLGGPTQQTPNFLFSIIGVLIMGVASLWIAIAWHRFVLLDERSSALVPSFTGGRLFAYLGRSLQLTIIGMIAAAILFLPLVALAAAGMSPLIAIAGYVIAMTVFLLITYRLAPMLPGAAIGHSVGVSEAWAATSGSTGTILLLAVITSIGSVALGLPSMVLIQVPSGAALAFVWSSIAGWINLMVGVSILTTIYGVYVEKRAIAE